MRNMISSDENTYVGPEANMLTCRLCGCKVRLNLPLPTEVARDLLVAFSELHGYCEFDVFRPSGAAREIPETQTVRDPSTQDIPPNAMAPGTCDGRESTKDPNVGSGAVRVWPA